MGIESWIMGPQLIGIICLVIGLITLRFPPKSINAVYGYRMPSAMKNQQTWDEANRFSTWYMIKSGLVLIIVGLLITLFFKADLVPGNVKELLTVLFLILSGIISSVLIIVATEKHLDKTFDQK